jgi:ribosomal protein S12 methylthiotransferase accessory factor
MSWSGDTTGGLLGFKRHLRTEPVKGEGVYVLSERGVTALRGSHIESLVPLLDGTRDLDTLLRDLPPCVSPEQVVPLVRRLTEAGLLTVRSTTPAQAAEPALGYWEACDLDATVAATNVATRPLSLVTLGQIPRQPALKALSASGLPVVHDSHAEFSVVLCDDYLDSALAEVDSAHRADGRPWLLAKPIGTQVWIGPVFTPGRRACWHCLATRLWGHRPAEAHVQTVLGREGPAHRPVVSVPALETAALQLIALEVTKWLAGYRYPGQGSVWTVDSLGLHGRHHEVRRRPQCPACGDVGIVRRQALRPVSLVARPKTSASRGHLASPPESVLDRYGHLVSPVTGVIKEIRPDRRGPSFFNAFRAGPNLARSARRDFGSLRAAMRAENGGKGVTAAQGEASALCEALERHSAHFHGDEARLRASYAELGDRAVHPDTCQLFHERQYRDRERWNAAHSPFQHVCAPFDANAQLDWTPVWSVTARRHRLLPTGLLYLDTPPESTGPAVRADSNGNAAGSSLEDAVLQGLLELVERDSVALWWYNRTRAPGVDLAAFADPWIDELQDVYAGLGRQVWLLDLTADFGVPTMAALSRRTGAARERIMLGFGAHFDPHRALRRALAELNQLMPAVLGPGDPYEDDPDAVRWLREATVENQPYLVPDPTVPPRRPGDFDHRPEPDPARAVETLRALLEAGGHEVLVLDQTRPDIGLPVVKVVVPGLRGFWARFAPGRLYDVPVRLGRRSAAVGYDELNPMPLFL